MQERLFIRLPASGSKDLESPGKVVWFIWHRQQQEVIASGELESPEQLVQLQQQARRCETTLVLPGQDVLLKQVELPAGTRRHLERVIPYALEEELATDIEQLHFSWPQSISRSASSIPVAVVADERMQTWLQWCNQAGIEAEHWYPETLLLPYTETAWSALTIADSVVVRVGPWQGFSVERSQLQSLIPVLTADWPAPEEIINYGDVDWPQPPAPLQSADIEVPVAAFTLTEGALELRRGDYAVKRKQQSVIHWKPLAIAASTAFVLLVGGNLARSWQLNQQTEQLNQQAEQLFREAFPDQSRIVNLRVQLQRKLDSVGAGAEQQQSALALLDALEPAFAAQSDMSLELLRYQNGELRLQALAQSFGQFEQFQQQAQQAGLSVEQGAVNSRGGGVAGSLTIARGNQS